jgi:SAM-dependent methyltransferase
MRDRSASRENRAAMTDYWDELFRSRKTELAHEPCLDEDAQLLKKGRLLDLGSGDGRNAFFFAEKGFEVTCLDASAEGLASVVRKAESRGVQVGIIQADARGDLDFLPPGSFDSIVMIHFFPGLDALERLLPLLTDGGSLYCVTFVKDGQEPGSSKHEIGISLPEVEDLRLRYEMSHDAMRMDERGLQYSFCLRSKGRRKGIPWS